MNILEEAASLINGERAREYGDAQELHERIGCLWSAYLGEQVSKQDVCMMMILLKMCRLKRSYFRHRDSLADLIGYAALTEKME